MSNIQSDIPEEQIEEPVEENELETLKQLSEEYKSKYLRALADYNNLERRVREEKENASHQVQARILTMLLPIIDNLEKAEIFIKDPGLKLVHDQLRQMLKQLGVEELKLVGKPFDPITAEAIDVIEGEKDNVIVEVVQKGYTHQGKVLRHAQVKVSRKK